jgi:shikimate 5-dehydrogenase
MSVSKVGGFFAKSTDSFAEAATKVLPQMAGLRLAESTVERVTEAAGQRLAEALQAGQTFGEAKAWAWHKDAAGKTVASISANATGVGQQGRAGPRPTAAWPTW